MMSARSMPTRLDSTFSPRVSRSRMAELEAFEDVRAEQLLQHRLVPFGEGHDDHLIGGLGAIEKRTWIEARIGAHQRGQRLGERAVLRRMAAKPRLDILHGGDGRIAKRSGAAARQRHDGLVRLGRPGPLLIRRRIGVEGLTLVARAPPKHIPQPNEDDDCEHQEQQRINVEGFTHPYRHPRSWKGPRFLRNPPGAYWFAPGDLPAGASGVVGFPTAPKPQPT